MGDLSTAVSQLAETVSNLERRNAALEAELHEHKALVNAHEQLKELLATTDAEARDARADKAALEQEIRLSGAQKAATRRNRMVVMVPFRPPSLASVVS